MVKRLLSATASEVLAMSAQQLKQSIKASEGRTVLSENVVIHPTEAGITTSEVAAAFGADLILLNALDVLHPYIAGLEPQDSGLGERRLIPDPIHRLQQLVGRPIGVNLEPVDPKATMAENRLQIPEGRTASEASLIQAEKLGFRFICLTGNPGTGVTNAQITEKIRLAKQVFHGLIIAGKMHGAGVNEPVISQDVVKGFVDAGADIILVPSIGTVPGFDDAILKQIVHFAHRAGALVMSAIGTSQESSGARFIEEVAIRNKIAGVDIQHVGDAAWGVQSPIENIYALSKAIRGERHTIQRMARSINR